MGLESATLVSESEGLRPGLNLCAFHYIFVKKTSTKQIKIMDSKNLILEQ